MKKALIIANMLFTSATVWGMMPHDHNENFGNKRGLSQFGEGSSEAQPKKKARVVSELPINTAEKGDINFRGTGPSVLELNIFDLLGEQDQSSRFSSLTELKIVGEIDERKAEDVKQKLDRLISDNSSTLQKLDLSSTNISDLPSTIGNCKNLVYLDLSKNPSLDKLPRSIKNCKNLQYLDISDNGMDTIPDIVFEFRELKHLEFLYSSETNGRMGNLSPKISNLTNLEFLAITGQFSLKTLPLEIGHLKNLKTLILEASGIEKLPNEIGNLENLNYLDLSACELRTLPAEIGKLRNLDFLNISNNEELESIPPEILNLFENRLKATDGELDNLTFMRYLLTYKSKTAMNDDALKKFVEQNQKEVEMLKERRNNLKSSLVGLRFYADADDGSVSGSESDSESAESTTDSSEE